MRFVEATGAAAFLTGLFAVLLCTFAERRVVAVTGARVTAVFATGALAAGALAMGARATGALATGARATGALATGARAAGALAAGALAAGAAFFCAFGSVGLSAALVVANGRANAKAMTVVRVR